MLTPGFHFVCRCLCVAGAAGVLLVSVSCSVSAAGAKPGLLSHRAVYRLSQHAGAGPSDIAGVKGRLEISFEVACDGWRVEQYIGFKLFHPDGAGLEHVAHLSGWESKSGDDFWFSSRSYQDRELLEELSGVARLEGAGGEVRFAKPEKETRPLPGGTIFPSQHLAELITSAAAGEQHLTRTVFDGSTLESPYEITAFIGKQRESANGFESRLIAGKRSWPFRLAYFKPRALEPSPEFELSAILYENGVAGDMIYDYGDFAIDVTLRELEALPVRECK